MRPRGTHALLALDHPLDPGPFADTAISEETRAFNKRLVKLLTPMPEWWDVGAETTREARRQGRGPCPALFTIGTKNALMHAFLARAIAGRKRRLPTFPTRKNTR